MNVLLGVQWVVFHLGVVMSVPVVLGAALGLSALQVGTLLQLTFFVTGAGSALQGLAGHRQMLIEGPGAPWWGAYIVLTGLALGSGRILLVRTDIAGAMMIAGAVLMLLGWLGVIRRFHHLFTCRVTGVLLLLLGLQIGGVGVRGMVEDGLVHFLIAAGVLVLVLVLLFRGSRVLKMSAIVVGVAVGWAVALLVGAAKIPNLQRVPTFSLPVLFPWGTPTFDPGSILALTVLGILLVPNVVGSIKAMEEAVGTPVPVKLYDRGLAVNGLINFGVGATGAIGTIPFVISAGLVTITGNKARTPFYIAAAIYIAMGIIGPLGAVIAAIPKATASAVLVVSVTSLAISGIRNINAEPLGRRATFIAGLGVLFGIGVMSITPAFWHTFPRWIAGVVSNGVIVGTLTAILLEQLLPRD